MNELPVLPVDIDTPVLEALEEFSGPRTAVPGTCAHVLIARHAALFPDAPAVTTPATSLTYWELNNAAEAVAAWLATRAVGRENPVAVLGERTADFLVALLGIWKAGAAYLPLDPAWPRSRSAEVLRQADCSLVLTTSAPADGWGPAEDSAPFLVPVREAVSGGGALAEASCDRPPAEAVADDLDLLAYVIFTSGSTGHPKGRWSSTGACSTTCSPRCTTSGWASATG